jgi:hypothetical protein
MESLLAGLSREIISVSIRNASEYNNKRLKSIMRSYRDAVRRGEGVGGRHLEVVEGGVLLFFTNIS